MKCTPNRLKYYRTIKVSRLDRLARLGVRNDERAHEALSSASQTARQATAGHVAGVVADRGAANRQRKRHTASALLSGLDERGRTNRGRTYTVSAREIPLLELSLCVRVCVCVCLEGMQKKIQHSF